MFTNSTLPRSENSTLSAPVALGIATTVAILLGGAWLATADDQPPAVSDIVAVHDSSQTRAPMRVGHTFSGAAAPASPPAASGSFAAPIAEVRPATGRFGRTGRRLDQRATGSDRPSLMLSRAAADLVGEVVRPVLTQLPTSPTLTTGHPLLETSPQERIAIQQVIAGELDAAIVCGSVLPQDAGRGLRTFPLGFHVAVLAVDKACAVRSVQSDALRRLLVTKDASWLSVGGPDKRIERQLPVGQPTSEALVDLAARLLVPGDSLRCTPGSGNAHSVTVTSLARFGSAPLEATRGQHLLAIDAVPPSLATARSGAYSAACPVHLVWRQDRAEFAHALRERLRAPAVTARLAATLTVE